MEISEDGRLGNYKKGNYGSSYQQSLNEIFATNLHKAQGFDNYTEYLLTTMDVESGIEGIGCMSYDFCSENIECISAWEGRHGF